MEEDGQRIPVISSNLCSVGYDRNALNLEIEFISGAVYRYFNVPENIYLELMNANSHGQYFHQNIRYVYQCERVR